jgi:hypothetical protein
VLLIEEERLAVFEIRLLLKVFGSKRAPDAGEWRNLHDEELYGWYVSPKQARHVTRLGEKIQFYRILVGRCERMIT